MRQLLLLCSIIASIFLGSTMLAPAIYASDSQLFGACNSTPAAASSPVCSSQGTKTNPAVHVIKVATDIVALLAGIAAIIMIIISGLTLITSSGNQEAVANARRHLTAAVIGLVIVALAVVIVTFVTDRIIKT